ncbi:hypothetical protein AcW1_000150 [Taiwanofungus camphoratus]|nr:hypothetical protein AcW2_001357 [Antrodia cinnamomea]KAI0960926.1 hypothetical protein AcV7_000167 [Antrodia cinnamomea]KAI0962922.1 hypothetical protein AcW1_000150 [Antrodia cinnamomea]
MKGITKAFARTPHMLTTKVGMSKKSSDPEFEDYARRFASIETATDKLLKDTKAYTEAVSNLFTHGAGYAQHFVTLFHPVAGEDDLTRKHPESEHTIRNVDDYETAMEELKTAIVPELELIESRVVDPIKELQGVLKTIRKSITKREHKLVDYDRYNNSLTKLRDKKEKTLSDEKHIFKLEQDFDVASNEYDQINSTMKTELPRFLVQATQFLDPLFHSFFYMQYVFRVFITSHEPVSPQFCYVPLPLLISFIAATSHYYCYHHKFLLTSDCKSTQAQCFLSTSGEVEWIRRVWQVRRVRHRKPDCQRIRGKT